MNLKEVIDIIEEGLLMPLTLLINPEKRVFIGYIITSLLLAFFVYKKYKVKGSFIAYVFPKKVWLGNSAKVDYLLVFFNSFIKILVIGPFLIVGLYIAYYTNEYLMRQFGIQTFNISIFWLIFLYTLSLTLINDLTSYLVHLAQHKIPFLWEFHKIHHSATDLNPFTQYRLHPLELIVNNARAIIVFGLLAGLFDYFSGGRIDKLTFYGVNIFSFAFLMFGANIRHSHIKLTYFNRLEYFLISPFQHQIHHSTNPNHFDKNLGSKLAIWDWLFGTLVRSNEAKEELTFGLGNEDKQYISFWQNLHKPFTNIYRKLVSIKNYKFIFTLFFVTVFNTANAQNIITGTITDNQTNKPIVNVEIIEKNGSSLAKTNEKGFFEFEIKNQNLELYFYSHNYKILENTFIIEGDLVINRSLQLLSEELSEVKLITRREKVFALKRLKDTEGTAIYSGKKTEVVLVDQSMANLASNNARQIYSQVAGLNIYQNDDAGLQLNIGGRGLDPNRTANFNTRQNGYDISADVLGYPESYYTPAAEGLKEVQIVKGAASLQYGTQFGGLVNFIMKKPAKHKSFELVTRNTIGSNNLYTNFTSIGGTKNKFSYYTFYNFKNGNGFRPNSQFNAHNLYTHFGYKFNEKTKITAEVTYLHYLAQQAGGLTDQMFEDNPLQSNRERNWFEVDWLLYNLNLTHDFSEKTKFSFNFFGLNASRNALGFRSNRVDQIDPNTERDLIKGDFNNLGFEARLLSEYQLLGEKAIFLLGTKYYNAKNTSQQGPGSDGSDANFNFQLDEYPNYVNQSKHTFPNLNIALFGENILYFNEKFSITPGFRLEYIKTESDGYYKKINLDGAGNVINNETIEDNNINKRTFVLLGIGVSYKPNTSLEAYGNISQNYRSVTFSDISITNPAYAIDPDITDENGFTADLGIRGKLHKNIQYDFGVFSLFYKNRIGFIQRAFPDGSVKTERTNVGDAAMYGIESLIDFNLSRLVLDNNNFIFNYFINTSLTDSKYTKSEENGIEGNKVEFVPNINLKTGIIFGYKNIMSNIQFTYLSKQFTDASNAEESSLNGVIGSIPSYNVLDFSISYSYKMFKLEAGVNNLLNNYYFTRRATGYPGPGIIPSPDRNFYTTLQFKI